MTALKWEDIPCFYWSDSTTAVAWIHRNDDWGTFVGNRVREVVKLTNTENWRHIPGIYNPADLPSRGCSPKQLLQSRWWEGPPWLLQTPEKWPTSEEIVDEDEVNSEKKKTTRTLVVTNQNNWFEPKFSGFLKNVRVMGWIRRFVRNARAIKPERELKEFLTFTELRKAEKDLIQCIQMECFSNGLDHFKGMKVKKGEDNMWRISSKLTYKTDSLEFRSPLILPKDHRLVRQLVHHIHVVNCHAGTQFVLGRLREKYWILQGRKAVGDVIHKCVTCKRYASQNISVEPAPLPQNRVEIEEAYQTTGVDLAGPLFMENGEKCWIVLFTCGVYRAVHLDLVTSLSTEAFIGALERFINRNGRPKTVYSDNGTNFEGTANLFKKLDKEKILKESRVRLIQWIFNPPSAPWWERLVRSVKGLLRRMLGRAKLSYDELRTCLSAVEATINNRPLTTITEDTDDLIPLTPSMFTRGIMDNEFPESGHITSKELQLRYKRIQSLKCDLQARFRKEYLSLLVQKSHERKSKPPQVGDVVMVGADNKKRFDWPIGRILELFPGKDGTVRVATVKTATGILKRPLQRLYPLEITGANEIPISPKVKKSVAIKKPKQTTIPKEDIPEPEIRTKSGRKIVRPHRYGKWQHE